MRLRLYQMTGIRWLAAQRAALLADEQGLGKTVQALCAIPSSVGVIIECPASLRLLWRDECLRWRSDLTPLVEPALRWPNPGEAYIVSEGWVRKRWATQPWEGLPKNVYLVCDEAHRYKGRSTRTAAMSSVCADIRRNDGWTVALTGTPIMNTPKELYTLLLVFGAARKAFGGWTEYTKLWHAKRGRFKETIWGEPSAEVKLRFSAVSLRRTRQEVLPELPSKAYQTIPCEVSLPLQRKMDLALATLVAKLDEWEQSSPTAELSIGGHSALMRDLAEAKIPAMQEWIERMGSDCGPFLVFSMHVAPLEALANLEGWKVLSGDTPMKDRQANVQALQEGRLKGLGVSILAGGSGLTLTAAHNALFVDRSYVPAENLQAEDRMVRFGQLHPVLISTLVADHKLERRLNEILTIKLTTVSGVL